ncbi:MAG: PASTA domain-containing protein [Armatimonadota bacterium]
MAKYELNKDDADLKKLAADIGKMNGDDEPRPRATTTSTPAAKKKQVRTRTMLIGICCAAVLLLAVLVIIVMVKYNGNKNNLAVPNVVGKDAVAAQDVVTKAGFRAKLEYDSTGKQPDGTVISSYPVAGTVLPRGGDVTLKVAKKGGTKPMPPSKETKAVTPPGVTPVQPLPPPVLSTSSATVQQPVNAATAADGTIIMPDVVGTVATKARQTLENRGLKVQETAGSDPAQPERVVLASDPKADTPVAKGAVVRITVNTVAQKAQPQGLVEVKNYAGQRYQDAEADLKGNGLKVLYKVETTRVQPKGNVVRSDPPQGSQLPAGSSVTLIVAQ